MANTLVRTATVLLAITLIGRVVGFVRNVLLTNQFGLGPETDAYFIAFTIPSLFLLVIPGVINAVVVPPIKGAIVAQDLVGRQRMFKQTLTVVVGVFAALTVVGLATTDLLVHALAPGFAEAKHALTVELTRQMMPALFFIGVSAFLQGILSAHNQFQLPAIANLIYGTLVVAAIATLAPTIGIAAVGWSVSIGAAIYTLMLIPAVRRLDYPFAFATNQTQDPQMRAMGERFFPILLGLIITQLYTILEKIFASTLGDAKLTALGLANTIFQLPLGVFAASLVLPLFPLMTEQVKRGEIANLKQTIQKGFLVQYHLLLPMSVAMIIMPGLIVKVFYDHSTQFTEHDVQLTAWALMFIATGMIGWIGRDLMTRVFYALEDTKTPVRLATYGFIAYAGFAYVFIPLLDHAALAFSYALSSTLNMLGLAYILTRRIKQLFNKAFYLSILRGLIAVTVMALGVTSLRPLTQSYSNVIEILILATLGAIIYTFGLLLMREPLLKQIVRRFRD